MRTIATIALLALASCSAAPDDRHATPQRAAAAVSNLPDAPEVVFMNVGELVEGMRRDEAGTLKRLDGKRVMLKGVVARVGHVDQWMSEVIVRAPGAKGEVSLFAADDEIEVARTEPLGHLVSVSCAYVTGPANDVTARDCSGWD